MYLSIEFKIAPMFRLTGNQQTRLSLTTYFWSLWYSLNDTWLGASSSAYKRPGALHTPHAYTLAWCFGLQFCFFYCFFFLHVCVSAPLCASAQRVVLKSLVQTLKKKQEQNS